MNHLAEFEPTWYTAVPSINNAFLAEAGRRFQGRAQTSLRFIRSSLSPLPPTVMGELESTFGVPVIEAYGMTEAAHQIACNLLPPGNRKAGSVGPAAGPEVAIMGPALPGSEEAGEIVIRGESVFSVYEGNDRANQEAFAGGWFRTGDEGWIDPDGFVRLTGKIKEIINRGGEKVSPREVDEALLAHAAVARAVAFPVPHRTLGETVAAAVVPADRQAITESELRAFAATRLAAFKVPSRIYVVDEISKSPTGKLQRHVLAQHFGSLIPDAYVPPATEREKLLSRIWAEMLGVERVGVTNSFFDLGGDSLSAVRAVVAAGEQQLDMTVAGLLERPTIRSLLGAKAQEGVHASVQIQTASGDKCPFQLHESSGSPWAYRSLWGYRKDWSIVALVPPDRQWVQDSLDVPELTLCHVNEIRRIQPRGPYFLGAWSSGALLAFEAARWLARDGQETRSIVFLDLFPAPSARARLRARIKFLAPRLIAALPFGRAWLEKRAARTRDGRLALALIYLAGKVRFTSDDNLRGLRLAWPDRYRDGKYELVALKDLILDVTAFLPSVLRHDQWEALLVHQLPSFGRESVFKTLQTWVNNSSVSRLRRPSGSLDAKVDAFYVEGRSEQSLSWQRYLMKPMRLHHVSAMDLGSSNVRNDFLRRPPTSTCMRRVSLTCWTRPMRSRQCKRNPGRMPREVTDSCSCHAR